MVASWADHILHPDRSNNWGWSKQLHYVDTEDWVCIYDQPKDCNWTSGQRCVDGAIQNYTQRLADSQLDPIQRQEALQFLIHFIGDAHQPLHAGFKSDLGGNEIKVSFFDIEKELHAVWDTLMIEHRLALNFSSQPSLYIKFLVEKLNTKYAKNISDWTSCPSSDESRYLACSTIWLEEDQPINCNLVYLDENNQPMHKGTVYHLGETYYNTRKDTLEQRLIQGGLRLATVINKIVQSTQKHKKSNETCFGAPLLMMALFIQTILVIILVIVIVSRRKTTIIIKAPGIDGNKEYVLVA